MYAEEYDILRSKMIFLLEKFIKIHHPICYANFKDDLFELDKAIFRKKHKIRARYKNRSALCQGLKFRPFKKQDIDFS